MMLCCCLFSSSAMVCYATNSIGSALFLIAAFCNSAFLLFFFSLDFLALIYIIIYVGAIAVLLLFVIMMLNIKTTKSYESTKWSSILYVYDSFLDFCLIFLAAYFLVFFFEKSFSKELFFSVDKEELLFFLDHIANIDILGQVLFNYANICFLVAGIILLISLVGAIILTLSFSAVVVKSVIPKQLAKNPEVVATINI